MIKGIENSLVILKFLKALQEDTGNNFSYLVPKGDTLTQAAVSHPTVQPSGTLSGYSVPPYN